VSVHLPKGTRDFLPEAMRARHRIISQVQAVFDRFGFEPLETPAIERIETLAGKYGDETDKLMFRIHKRGADAQPGECDLALRYDLTVPLARVLAMNPDLPLPFKRWQIQPVWRAERPQRGRFREFWQCDVDIAGSRSSAADAECVAVADAALRAIGFHEYTIRINDRRILSDLARSAGAQSLEQELSVLIAIDKLDKVGVNAVQAEISGRGFDPNGLAPLWAALASQVEGEQALEALSPALSESGREGVATLKEVIRTAIAMGVDPARVRVDVSLARGADYYTGPVFEVAANDPSVGSVAGGGRYDGLVERLSGRDVPAVGLSLGLERLLVLLEGAGALSGIEAAPTVLVTVFDATTLAASSEVARRLREGGIATELYVGDGKLKAQFKLAARRGHRWLAIIGPDEVAAGTVTLKNQRTWENVSVPVEQVVGIVAALDPGTGVR
jgi:histidyl-tRNA synthetase